MEKKKNKFAGLVYVIDENYNLIYMNEAMRNLFPSINCDKKCYEALAGDSKACRACPLRTGRQRFYYNKKIDNWLRIDAADIEWPSVEEDTYIFKVDYVSNKYAVEYFLSLYDTSGHYIELNIDKNECMVFYSGDNSETKVENRHEKNFSEFIQNLSLKYVHPLDREDFLEFWDIGNLSTRLKESWQEGMVINEFIEKDRDGEWQVVLHLIVDVPRAKCDDHIVRCFSKIQPKDSGAFDRKQLLNNAVIKMGLDNLTGLPREKSFFEKADKFLDDKKEEEYCIVAIDIPNFWIFNKQNSHEVGDQLLIEIANVLKQFQLNVGAVVGYFGNDDFAIILPLKRYIIEKLYNQLNSCLSHYPQANPFNIKLSGYTLDDRNVSVNMAYDYALNAYGMVEGMDPNSIKWYNPEINFVENNYCISKNAMEALKNNEFIFYLQAQVDMETREIRGAESLVRWISKERGMISPAEFIPTLERTGLVTEVDLFVWKETIKWMGERIKANKPIVPISINVSRIDCANLNVVKTLIELCDEYKVPHHLVKPEITETAFVDEKFNIREIFDRLRKEGFKVMLDDFGSGLSSLSTLDNINVDFLKLDMELVRFRETNFEKKVSIVASIVDMSNNLELPLVAEGIENEKQFKILHAMGVEYGQGLLFYPALPVEEFERLLDEKRD